MPTKTAFSSLLNRPIPWWRRLIAVSAGCLLVTLAFAAKPVPQLDPINVTTIVHDEDASQNQFLMRSDDYNATFQASYNDPSNFKSTTSLTHSGWGLSLYMQTLRTVWLTLSKPVGTSPVAPAPDGYYSTNIEIYSRCYDANNQQLTTSNVAMQAGTANTRCDFGLDFGSGGVKYKFVMGPQLAGTGWAMVICNAVSATGACNNWTISPNATAGFGNVPTVANLYRFDNKGAINLGSRNINFDYIGQYYNTFRIDVTNP